MEQAVPHVRTNVTTEGAAAALGRNEAATITALPAGDGRRLPAGGTPT
jgi:hypothetical protein